MLVFSFLLVVSFLFTPIATQAADLITVVFSKWSTYALKDPFYPDYPQRRVLFPTTNLPWWGITGLSKYTITSKDPRVGIKTVTFYSSGYTMCPDKGLEMGLPFGNAHGSSYLYRPCTLSASDDFHFLFPVQPIATQGATLTSPAKMTSEGGLNITVYLPLNWWNN